MNQLKISLPKTEELIDALNRLLQEKNSDFYIEYKIQSAFTSEKNYSIEMDSRFRFYSEAKFSKYSDMGSDKDNKEEMFYRSNYEAPRQEFELNYDRLIGRLDSSEFNDILKLILFAVDSTYNSGLYGYSLKVISWNTMLNTKRDETRYINN